MRLEQKLSSLVCAGLLIGFSVVEAEEATDTNQLISAARAIAFEIDDEHKRWRALVSVEGAEALFGDRSSGKAKLIALGELADYDSDFQLVLKYLLKLGAIEEIERLLAQSGPSTMNLALQAVSDQSYDDGLLKAANLIEQPFERALAFQTVGIMASRGGHVADALAALEEVRKFAPRSSTLEVELLCELAKHWETLILIFLRKQWTTQPRLQNPCLERP